MLRSAAEVERVLHRRQHSAHLRLAGTLFCVVGRLRYGFFIRHGYIASFDCFHGFDIGFGIVFFLNRVLFFKFGSVFLGFRVRDGFLSGGLRKCFFVLFSDFFDVFIHFYTLVSSLSLVLEKRGFIILRDFKLFFGVRRRRSEHRFELVRKSDLVHDVLDGSLHGILVSHRSAA